MDPTVNKKPLNEWTDEERVASVKKIFREITPVYDRMNRIMSARQDVHWRRFTVRRIPENAGKVIDIATGTGDLAMDIKKKFAGAEVFGVDFVKEMLDLAVLKLKKNNSLNDIYYELGDAMHLPFRENQFDASTIAFGLRNIPDRLGAVQEMARVVKPGGKVMVLEMTFPRNMKLRKFFFWHLNRIIPLLGKIVAKNSPAYTYLPESIQDFMHPDELAEVFKESGLINIKAFPLSFGITYLHEGIAP